METGETGVLNCSVITAVGQNLHVPLFRTTNISLRVIFALQRGLGTCYVIQIQEF